ncbi:uncharacterized protein SCHCODRAFT_02505490 [Schizophyllum commune H4-8]|uniref:Uncharacterized protein n=1 Tax=Schizophyllum commune (strain H4-8 / FGSC 9210) TaxID=578458 RepID=D8Q745_SCHCM|nr:uncharacterized protein SCHCODRAFT_02505490 [Schizophyllum commune H4-8]KAI5891646.1 hypothetical protein SCHCODRAFT_02505490 [Schizophyllum commune H4-8]
MTVKDKANTPTPTDSDDTIDLNDDEEDIAPLLPYPLTVLTVQASLKTDQVPSWDGDKATVVEYLLMVYGLANSGGHLNRAVGFWLWTKLKSGSPVWQWFMTLSDSLKAYMKRSAHKFLYVVQRDYLGLKWVKKLATEFQFHSYQEPKHRHETPSQFIYRCILTARALAFAPMNSREEVRLILSVAPLSWGIVLVPSTIRSTDQLSSRVLEFEEELMNSSKSTGGELRSQIASVLKELGQAASSSASKPGMFARRSASAFDAEVEPIGEAGGSNEAEDDEGVAGDMLAVAYNVVSARERQRPPSKPPFPRDNKAGEGCKTQEAEEQAPVAYVMQTPSFAMTIEEIEDNYWYKGELLPADSPHILESIYKEPEAERSGVVSEEVHPTLWASEFEEDRIYTLVAQALEEMPKPYDSGKVKLKPRIKSIKKLNSMGASVLCVKGFLGSDREFEVMLRMDSCASILLLSGKVYDSLKQLPKLLQGAKTKLWQLTNKSVSIRGYCQMPILIRMDGGTLVEMDVTMYVVDNMTVPVLLGEDFQQAYELSVNRSLEEGTTITFGQTEYTKTAQPLVQTAALHKEAQSVEKAYIGERPTHSFLKKAARHRHQKAFKDKKKRAEKEDHTIRAAQQVLIKPESVALVPVRGPFDEQGEWLVEKELLSSSRDRPFLVLNTLISSNAPVVPVANTATVPRFIQEGEALGTVTRAEECLDRPQNKEELRRYQQHTAFMAAASQVAQEPPTEPRAKAEQWNETKVHPKFHMPEEHSYEAWKKGERTFPMPDAASYESWKRSFSRQEMEEDQSVLNEQEQVGPKTAEMPVSEVDSSQ